MKFFILVMLTLLMTSAAHAEKAGECTRLWQLEREMGCPAMPPEFGAQPSPAKQNFLVNSEFGPSKCVTRDGVDKEKKNLRKECDEWTKERKADLGASYMTGTCSATCEPCPSSSALSRCTVKGEVHYSNK